MEQLVVLDYSDLSVHIYNLDPNYNSDMEDLLSNLGHHPSNCSYMFGENVNIEFHKGVINENSNS